MAPEEGLERFVDAQADGATYDRAVSELRAGHKASHWMWFVFPQLAGLGQSPTAVRFALSGLDEARAFLAHRVLGPRLIECADLVARSEAGDAADIFGTLDAMKLRSSMTLFLRAAPDDGVFRRVLDRYFGGEPDPATERLLMASEGRANDT